TEVMRSRDHVHFSAFADTCRIPAWLGCAAVKLVFRDTHINICAHTQAHTHTHTHTPTHTHTHTHPPAISPPILPHQLSWPLEHNCRGETQKHSKGHAMENTRKEKKH